MIVAMVVGRGERRLFHTVAVPFSPDLNNCLVKKGILVTVG
jgi:hypothetical protein